MKENLKNRENKTLKTENVENNVEQEFDDSVGSSMGQGTSSSSRIESITENGVHFTRDQCIKIFKRCRRILRNAQVYEKFDCFMKYLLTNPILLIGFTIITAFFIVPVLLFTVFAIINVAIAFTGFMIIEVVLLLIGLTVLCCILFFILSSVVITGVSFIVSAYVTYFSYTLVKQKIQSK